MIKSKPAGLLGILLISTLSGCLGTTPNASPTTAPTSAADSLYQVSDNYWIVLSQIREAQFSEADPSQPISPSNRSYIYFYHKGMADIFSCTFADEPSAYAAWNRLVAHLGGSSSLIPVVVTAAPTTQLQSDAAPSGQQGLFQGSSLSTADYAALRRSLGHLNACRDAKLISDAEYDAGRAREVDSFAKSISQGITYQGFCDQLHAQLLELDGLKKVRILTDQNAADIRQRIIVRYGLTPEPTQ